MPPSPCADGLGGDSHDGADAMREPARSYQGDKFIRKRRVARLDLGCQDQQRFRYAGIYGYLNEFSPPSASETMCLIPDVREKLSG